MQRWLREALHAARVIVDVDARHVDLRGHATLRLPVRAIDIRDLTTNLVKRWLNERNIPSDSLVDDRELHGCVVARRGRAIIFVSADDPDDERAFTFAHELAHFIVEFLVPRERALSTFGETVRPVLDGHRPATKEELLGAVLDGVPLGTQVHLMARDAGGCISSWSVEDAEQRADRLALELAVPARTALGVIRELVADVDSEDACTRAAEAIATRFRLPMHAASAYAEILLGTRARRASTLDLFGGR